MATSLLVAAALAIPGAAATTTESHLASQGPQQGYGDSCLAAGSPPCGYITPLIDLDFPTKPKCPTLGGTVDLARCIPLPPESKSVSFEGTIRWYWKLSEDLTYPPQEDIVLSFGTTRANPGYLPFKVEPSSFTIDAAALFSPDHMVLDQSGPSPIVYYSFAAPVKVTFSHAGAPDADAAQMLRDRQGLQSVSIKAQSTSSGAYFKEAFGYSEFRFNATGLLQPQQATSKASPVPVLAPLLALVLVAARRRRTT